MELIVPDKIDIFDMLRKLYEGFEEGFLHFCDSMTG